ncbi:MAG: PAS domain-containing protein [Kiritimatiellaeota bacterium]|nr:PAS domain-containing protein [Kiritimatiellota bacterium]
MRTAAETVPIIVLTGTDDEELAVRTLQQGAQNYIVKGREDGPSLARAIRYAIERCRAQAALAQERDLLRSLMDNIPDQVYLKDMDSRFVSVNPATARLFGAAAPGELIGKCDFDFFPRELAEQFRAEEQTLLHCDQPCVNREVPITDSAGNPRWVLTTKVPLRDHAGHITGLLGINRDITEHKQTEVYREMGLEVLQILNAPGDLRGSIQRVLAILKMRTGCDAVGIRLQDGDDFPYYAQQGFPKAFLLTENTLIAPTADGGLCRDKDGNVCLECTCGLVISGKTDPSNPLFTRGGSCWTNDSLPLLELPSDQDPRLNPRNQCIHQGYASVALVPIRAQDMIVGLLQFNDRRKGCFTRDTIEILEGIAAHIGVTLIRKQAAEEVRFQKMLLESQNEASIDGILNVDENGRIIWFNRQFLEMWGIPADVVQSRSDEAALRSVLDKLLDPQAFSDKVEYLYKHKDLKSRDEIQLKDGREFDRYSAPVRSSTGSYLGRVWLFRDITERKQAQKMITQALADLTTEHEKLIATQMQLIEAAKMKSVGQLAASVAHEVKNPLAIALMGLEYLSSTVAINDDRVATVVKDTKEAIQRADIIIRELMNFSVPAKLEMKHQDLNRIVEHTVHLMRHEARKRNVTSNMDLGPSLPHLPLDGTKIEQTLVNLCMNAIEAMPTGGTLLVRTRANQLEAGATEVIVDMEDTGAGIPEADLVNIFEPFFSRKQVGKGFGLGLSVSKQIIELHGGTLQIGNRPAGGAKVTITLKT